MPKRYRKPITPTTKKTFVGIDKDNGKDVYVDTGLPWITTTQEYQREVIGQDYPKHECALCGVKTNAMYQRCFECKELDNDLKKKLYRLSRLTREGIIPEDNSNGVIDAEWKPNSNDTNAVEETNRLCTNCFITLPKAFGLKRLCESCRKD